MLSVIALSNFSGYYANYWIPLLKRRKKLRDGYGLKVSFTENSKVLADADVAIIDCSCFDRFGPTRLKVIDETLDTLNRAAVPVIWFDTSDSSGTPQLEVLTRVHTYLKSYTLIDPLQYASPYHLDRYWADRFAEMQGIHPVRNPISTPAPSALAGIQVGWSYGGGYFGAAAPILRQVTNLSGIVFSTSLKNSGSKEVDASMRVCADYSNPLVSQHRRVFIEAAQRSRISSTPLSRRAYMMEMQRAKCVISPFGWGEVCLRDFEAITAKAALLKPDMNHLRTWPNVYVPFETYVPLRWDASDLRDKLDWVLSGMRWQRIASNALDVLHAGFDDAGEDQFTLRLSKIIKGCHAA